MKKLIVLIALSFLSLSAMADCEVQENARMAFHMQDIRQAAESIRQRLPPLEIYHRQREPRNSMQEVLRAHRQIELRNAMQDMQEVLSAHRQIGACAEYADTDKRRQLSRR